ncbi:MAG: type II secretion system protein, partial [Acidimicrobiales bacterium]
MTPRRSESGDTLIEILIAITILGIAGIALLVGFATAITNSSVHRQLATLDASARASTSEVIAQVQASQDKVFGSCPSTYTPTWSLTGTFTVSAYSYQYWNGLSWVPGNSYTWNGSGWTTVSTNPTNCTTYGPQQWTMTITNGSTSNPQIRTVNTVVYDPNAPGTNPGGAATQLVFLQPTTATPGTGTVGAAVNPQPLVAIEDVHNQIVYSDASSVSLKIVTGPTGGTLSSSCSAVENDGIFSFGDCSLSAVGSYTLQAVDTDGLTTASSAPAPYSISAAPPAQLVFTTSPVSGVASQSAALGKITVTQEDYQGNPVNAGAGGTTVSLSSNTAGTYIFNTTQLATTPIGPTSVVIPSGSSSVSFYYGDTKKGTPTIQASSIGLQSATQVETVSAGSASKVTITPSPTSASASSTTNMTLGLQLTDAFGNTTTAGTGGVTLTLSSNSSKEFFSSTLGGTGTLNAPVN